MRRDCCAVYLFDGEKKGNPFFCPKKRRIHGKVAELTQKNVEFILRIRAPRRAVWPYRQKWLKT
jgi:hypothetical protein